MSNDTRIAVDVAKAVFEIAISDRPGHVVRRERPPRSQFLAFMAQQPPAIRSRDVARSAYFKDSRCRIARSSASSSEPRMTSSFSSIVARCPGESDVCGSTC
jgi:hypothetical protein